ncbi:MAG: polysaccharide biosynthesis tyrosine autokinase [Flavobacteriales bacterium]|nr:polysaccharide biosynthesis tyrosine autokinase [Flavobacteriales bacterium]NUQ16293.1 polysaccharide biosynthesis tyrosine autokinase [Flavobacteriales bacterium]
MATPGSQAKGGIIDVNDLRYFARIFSKNWYFVVVALVLSAALSYLYSYKIPEVHGASAQILLKDREVYNYQTQVYQSIGYVAAYSDIVNQKRVLTSYDLVDKALSKLDFDISYYIIGRFKVTQVYGSLPFTVKMDLLNPRYYERPFDLRVVDPEHFELSYDGGTGIVSKVYAFGQDVVENDFLLRVDKSAQLTAGSFEKVTASDYQFVRHSRSWLVNKYKSGMQVENLEYTTILQVTVEDEIPARAKMFLDTLSREYINYTLQSEFDINQNTLNYIDKQLEEVTVILNRFEDELQHYKESRNILDLSREEDRYFNELVRFDNERRKLELKIQSLNDLEDYIMGLGDEKLLPPSLYILEDDVFLRSTLSELYAMQMNRNSMLFDATPENLSVNRLDSTIMLNRGNLLLYVKNSRTAIQAKIQDVQAQMDDYERLIRTVPLSQRDILNIERRLQVNEKLYIFLLEKRANTVIARAGIVPQTKVIELARSIGVVRPDKVKILYAFLVGGMVVSLVIVFIRVMFYDRIENAEQLKAMVHMPVFGEIIASDKAEENYVVVDSDPKSAITESFRTVRTNLEYLPGPQGSGRVVLVTSYRPNEGKTFCSVNLSAILAKAGKRVLLLELDLHKPKVGKGLNMTAPQGLSNLLVGHVEPAAVVLPTQVENFHVILSGPTPPNASELVLSRHLEELFRFGRQHYDYVIIDTPPVGLITDALVMMKHVDATLFVVNTRFANKDHLGSAMEVIQSNPVRNFGFILNGVRMKKSKYYYNTNYGYGYRYAYGYGSGYGYGYGYGYGRRRRGSKAKDGADTEA